MGDVFTKQKRSAVMSRIRGAGNRDTELRLITLFRANGITGWRRRHLLVGKPDFVFRREKMVVFVDGCFWHDARSTRRGLGITRNSGAKKS
jgi:DNA mismatch endonuclease, patch repair protein